MPIGDLLKSQLCARYPFLVNSAQNNPIIKTKHYYSVGSAGWVRSSSALGWLVSAVITFGTIANQPTVITGTGLPPS